LFARVLLVFYAVFLHHAFEEEGDGAFALRGFAYFGAGCEDA
jgi:hypothetical protein